MATVTGLTAERMLEIEAACIVAGAVVLDDLILTRHDGTFFNAGDVRGPIGPSGVDGDDGSIGPVGAKGTSFFTVIADLANISGVAGSVIGDYFVNADTISHTILGINTGPGSVVRATSATAGTPSGSVRGAVGAQGNIGPQGNVGNTGATGAKGVSFYTIFADMANISAVAGSLIGDYFVNSDTMNHTILGNVTGPGGVIRATSATAGTPSGSVRGPVGPQGNTGATGPAGTATRVTSLTPGSGGMPNPLVDGMEVVYVVDSANGILWRLRYNAGSASAYKWEFVGGPPRSDIVSSGYSPNQPTSSTSFTDLATVGPSVVLPLAGDYMLEYGATCNVDGVQQGLITPGGIITAVDANALWMGLNSNWVGSSMRKRFNAVGVGTVTMKYRTGAAGTANFTNRYLAISPIRVG